MAFCSLTSIVGPLVVLELKSVGKVFSRGTRLIVALDRICLGVDRGDCVALYGTSRSGKSTLLRLCAGAQTPTSGAVLYDGHDLGDLSERRLSSLLRSEIAWVPASPDFDPGLTVLEQVALAGYLVSRNDASSKRDAHDALRRAGIAHCAQARPSELSDGELRLAAIAEGIVKRPRLLLADEPATHLDPPERDRVLELLRALAAERGVAVLFSATHADETLRSTWLARLDAGRLTVPTPPQRAEVIDLSSRKAVGDRSHA
jgi:putative ABC transport system ATP-binding protein